MPSNDETKIILTPEEQDNVRARFPGLSISNAARIALGFAALKHGGRRRRRVVEPIRDKQNNDAANPTESAMLKITVVSPKTGWVIENSEPPGNGKITMSRNAITSVKDATGRYEVVLRRRRGTSAKGTPIQVFDSKKREEMYPGVNVTVTVA